MLFQLLTLAALQSAPVLTAQVQPCVWPNVCKDAPAPAPSEDKPFSTCALPNKCA